MQVSGEVAIVTGGASGLGAATARALAAAGARVALLDMNVDAAAEVARDIDGLALACDVTSAASAEAAVDRAARELGPARVLVSCAGIAPPKRLFGRHGPQPLDAFRQVVEVNLIGTFNLMRVATAAMAALEPNAAGERGVVVNTASVAAFEGQVGQAAYAASKGGVAAMTLPAARELARHGIRVAAIAPGIFGTPMLFGLPDDVQRSLGEQVPFPSRLGDPGEFAALALHIIANPMLNGEVVRLDGALRMPPG